MILIFHDFNFLMAAFQMVTYHNEKIVSLLCGTHKLFDCVNKPERSSTNCGFEREWAPTRFAARARAWISTRNRNFWTQRVFDNLFDFMTFYDESFAHATWRWADLGLFFFLFVFLLFCSGVQVNPDGFLSAFPTIKS